MLLVLFGPPSVGKMTVGRALAAASDFRLFHNHMTIEPMLETFDFGTPGFNVLNGGMWLWKSRKSLTAATARPTVILPTAGGPKVTRSMVLRLPAGPLPGTEISWAEPSPAPTDACCPPTAGTM